MQRCIDAEVQSAKLALVAAEEMIAELQLKAHQGAAEKTTQGPDVRQLHQELATLRGRLGEMRGELDVERRTSYYFEAQHFTGQREVARLVKERDSRGWRKLCPIAELHQTLHEAGVFERDELAQALAKMYHHSLCRMALQEEGGSKAVKAGGQSMHLGDRTASAYATFVYNHGDKALYELFRNLQRWPPLRTTIAIRAKQAFAEVGSAQLEWGQQAARICRGNNIDPATEPFIICWDRVNRLRLEWAYGRN